MTAPAPHRHATAGQPDEAPTPKPPGRPTALLVAGVIALWATRLPGQETATDAPNTPFDRIENEAKLNVPAAQTEAVWNHLQARYADPSFLDDDSHRFTATFGDEQFVDIYFDTPRLELLHMQCGVRLRTRVVAAGSALAKDGRQLLQIKWNRNDPTGLERTEVKFTVEPAASAQAEGDMHPLFGWIKRSERASCYQYLVEAGIQPDSMRPIVTIHQGRRRVYLSDQQGAFATISLDMVRSGAWLQQVSFTEVELELNEIRYTAATPATRARMNAVNEAIEADLLAQFPDLTRDQAPKYNKVFTAIETGAPIFLPIRTLIALGVSRSTLAGAGLCLILLLVSGIVYRLRTRHNRRSWKVRSSGLREWFMRLVRA